MNNKIIFAIVLLVLIGLVFFGANTTGLFFLNPNINEQKETTKIGVILPLTGVSSDAGQNMREGLLLALGEVNSNKNNKEQIELIFEDSQYKPEAAVTAAQKLIAIDNVSYIIGPYGSSEVLAVAPITESNKVILMVPTAGAPEISDAGDYVFRIASTANREAEFFANYLLNQIKGKSISILAFNTALGTSYVSDFSKYYTTGAGSVTTEQFFPTSETNFTSYLLKAQQNNTKNLLIVSNREKGGAIFKQAKENGFDFNFYAASYIEGLELLNTAKGAAEGLIFPSSFDANSQELTQKGFQEKYFVRYGKKAEINAAQGYDALMLLSKCIEKITLLSETVKHCLYETQNYLGASGELSFDSKGDVSKSFIVKKVREEKFVVIQDK